LQIHIIGFDCLDGHTQPKGAFTLVETFSLPTITPIGLFVADLTAVDQNGDQITCVSINVTVTK
jgi:hypothetical protein